MWDFKIKKRASVLVNRIKLLTRHIQKYKKLEYAYAIVAFTFGLAFIFLVPPGWNPDEPQHYWRTQQIAHGNFISDTFPGPNGITYTGGKLLPDESNFILSYGVFTGIIDYSFRLNFPMWKNDGAIKHAAAPTERIDVAFAGSARYSPVVYAPQVVGVWLGNTLNLPLLGSFMVAKLFGLIVQVGAIAFAIRLIPRGKWILFVVGLLPSTVTQSVALGGDVMTTSVSILFIALIIKVCFDTPRITMRHILAISIMIMLLGLVKPAYLPLAGLVILLPIYHKQFRERIILLKTGLIFFLASLPGLIWLKITAFIEDNYNHGVDPLAQKAYIIENPINFLIALLNTYLTDAQPKLYKTLFGNFVWDTAPIPLLFMFMIIAIIVLTVFLSSPREKIFRFTTVTKGIFLSITFLLVAVISYGLYVYYSPLKDTSIMGIQSRYFIPFLPLALLAIHAPLKQSQQKTIKFTVLTLLIITLLVSVIVIINRIYT